MGLKYIISGSPFPPIILLPHELAVVIYCATIIGKSDSIKFAVVLENS